MPVDFNKLAIDDLEMQSLSSIVRISRTREGLLLQINGAAEIKTSCTRCLEDFFLPVSTEFDELYQFPSRQKEETDLILPLDGYLDLRPLYREYFILGIPIKRLCQPDCKGLCVYCGTNLKFATCEHHQNEESDPEHIEGGETV